MTEHDDYTSVAESVFMEHIIADLKTVLHKITALLHEHDIHFTFIGGVALNMNGYHRQTDDIDLLVDVKDKQKMLELPVGYVRDLSHGRGKAFKWNDPQTKVEAIYTGEISGDGVNGLEYVNPDTISQNIDGVPVLRLEELIRYKLSSGIYGLRGRDLIDVENLVYLKDLPRNYADGFRKDLKREYIRIWNKVQDRKDLEKTSGWGKKYY